MGSQVELPAFVNPPDAGVHFYSQYVIFLIDHSSQCGED